MSEFHNIETLLKTQTLQIADSVGISPADVTVVFRNSKSGCVWQWCVTLNYSYLPRNGRKRVFGTVDGSGATIEVAAYQAVEELWFLQSTRHRTKFIPAPQVKP